MTNPPTPPARKRIWRKTATRAILCLLLGAVTTVGVVVLAVTRTPEDTPSANGYQAFLRGKGQSWCISWDRYLLQTQVVAEITPYRGSAGAGSLRDEPLPPAVGAAAQQTVAMLPLTDFSPTPLAQLVDIPRASYPAPTGEGIGVWFVNRAFGWPWRAAWYMDGVRVFSSGPSGYRGARDGAVSTKLGTLPVNVLFPGFLLDTLFYAAPWWLILITPGALKRWRRRRRGRCIHCGYDLAGLTADDKATPTCPECGA